MASPIIGLARSAVLIETGAVERDADCQTQAIASLVLIAAYFIAVARL